MSIKRLQFQYGFNRRSDIIVVNRKRKSDLKTDPTIRFENFKTKPNELAKKNKINIMKQKILTQ